MNVSAAKIYVTQPIPEKALARLRGVGDVKITLDSGHIIANPELIASMTITPPGVDITPRQTPSIQK